MSNIIIAIDVGSSSIRCCAYEYSAHEGESSKVSALPNSSFSVKTRCVQPNSGKINISPDKCTMLHQIETCLDETLESLRPKKFSVVGLGITTFAMNLIGVDANGEIIGKDATFSYACNTPDVAEECRRLRQELGEDETIQMYQRTGTPIHSAYALPQLRSYYKKFGKEAEAVKKWQSIASLCLSRWCQSTRHCLLSLSEASWMGLLDYSKCEWDVKALSLLPYSCRDALSAVYQGDEPFVEGLAVEYLHRWPEMRSCRFHLGMADGVAAQEGSKCTMVSRIAVTIGTSAAVRICLPLEEHHRLDIPPGLWCYRVNRTRVLVGGALTDGGSIVEWARSFLNLTDQAFHQVISSVSASQTTNHLTILPFLSGERSTGFRDNAQFSVMGCTRETTSIQFVHGCLESVVLRIHAIIKLIHKINQCPQHLLIIASGGALERNRAWRQMIADCTGHSIVMDSEANEGTMRGVARSIANSFMVEKDIHEKLVPSERLEPDNKIGERWKVAALNQEHLIKALSPLWA